MPIIKSLIIIVLFPFWLSIKVLRSKKHALLKILFLIFSLFVLAPLWAVALAFFYQKEKSGLTVIGQKIGVVSQMEYVSGTGSMYPTFPKGKGNTNLERASEIAASHIARSYPGGILLNGKRYFGYELQRGDIIFFDNQKTREIITKEASGSAEQNVGFVKRLIALPGDIIEIRDGFIKINNEISNEPYIAKARSTYGGNFLSDCQQMTIPNGYVFVLGDNRKASNDSRFDLGLVALKDIKTVIPIDKQEDLKINWRNTTNDTKEANKPVFDSQKYLVLLNAKRKESGLAPLTWKNKLEAAALKRSQVILDNNDTSFEATRSGYTMKKALNEVGYYNIVIGEVPAVGYYEAEELLDNYFQFPDSKQFLLKPEFSDTGVSAAVGEINGCPTQVVVQHLAGYVPPNYNKEVIDNWKKLVDNLNDVTPSWEKAREYEKINQDDLNKLIDLLKRRKNNAQKIFDRMNKNEWLTDEEEKIVNDDENIYNQIKELTEKLNSH